MIKLLTDLCDKHAPLIKIPKRKINYIYKLWITKDILPYIIAKNKIAANRHKNPEQFKKMRNYVNKNKNSYFRDYFSEHSKNAKKVWEGIRCAIEWNKSKKNNITSIIDKCGITVTDPKLIAQEFAKYFKEIPYRTVSKIPKGSVKTDYNTYLRNSNCFSSIVMKMKFSTLSIALNLIKALDLLISQITLLNSLALICLR